MKNVLGKIFFAAVSPLFFVALFAALPVHASSLYVTPASGTFPSGENFKVTIRVDADSSINAISGVVRFPTDSLQVIRVVKDGSIINLWTVEPSFSNTGDSGNVSFEGVILNPGFIGKNGNVLTITFQPKKTDTASLSVSRSSVLANDGKGTSLLISTAGASYTLTPPRPAQPSKDAGEGLAGEVGQPVVIIREVESRSTVDEIWNAIPSWLRFFVIASVGITSAIFAFIILSFAVLILVWLWSNVWHRRTQIRVSLILFAYSIALSIRRFLVFLEITREEVVGDTRYLYHQLKNEYLLAQSNRSLSLSALIVDYVLLIGRVTRRFFTKQTPDAAFFEDRMKTPVDKVLPSSTSTKTSSNAQADDDLRYPPTY